MIQITNISKGLIVCDLSDGNTLRLLPRSKEIVKKSQITEYLKSISEKGLITLTDVSTRKKSK